MERLFSDNLWSKVEQRVHNRLKHDINTSSENQLLNTSIDDHCEYFVKQYWIHIPVLNRNEIVKDYEDTRIDVSGDQSSPDYVQGARIEIRVPYTGETAAFNYQPTIYILNPPRAHVNHSKQHLILVITGTNLASDTVLKKINGTLDKIDNYLNDLRKDAAKLNGELASIARQCIEERRTELRKNRDLFASLPFKLEERDDSLKTHEVPKVRRTIKLQPSGTGSQSYQSLDEVDYERILTVIENMTRVMEYSPAAFSGMGEEVLRWHFLVQLNGHYEGQATGETFNCGGKTDILIRSKGKNIFIAECKYWGGPKTVTDAINQLLGYSSWRDTKVAIIVFNRNKNFTKVLDSIKSTTKGHPNCKRELDQHSETSSRFIFSHRDDVNREMTLTVMAFDVPK